MFSVIPPFNPVGTKAAETAERISRIILSDQHHTYPYPPTSLVVAGREKAQNYPVVAAILST
jgi:hypothetical protein